MKIIKYISLITLALLLVACSKGESENKSSDQKAKATETPKKSFQVKRVTKRLVKMKWVQVSKSIWTHLMH
ncbi:hypothetical protein AAA447_00910 [Staphylococcus equorum]